MPLAPGQTINNRYQVIALLGQGGFGAVYQARDLRLGSIVALKENLGGDARQFQQEAVMLANLHHPNLPRVTDHFVEPSGAQYLVMDFIAGEDLATRLQRQGALNEVEATRWMDQILDAVAFLHGKGIIHRDIKPANIKITPEGQAVLVDFGIAKVYQAGSRTQTGAKAVSPGYAAPEQYRGGTDQRSDVYSLGATLYALLVGGDPPDAQARERNIATLTSPRILKPTLSARIDQVVQRAMAVQAAQRFQSAAELKQAMTTRVAAQMPRAQTQAQTLPASVVVAPTLPAASTQPRSRNWIFIVGAILGVCILCACGFFALAIIGETPAPTPTRIVLSTLAVPTRAPTATTARTATPQPTNTPVIRLATSTLVTTRPSTPKPSGLISKVTMALDSDSVTKNPVNPTTVFQPTSVFHAIIATQNAPANTVFKAAWYAVDVGSAGTPNTLIDSTDLTTDGTRNVDFWLTPSTQWPVGTYRVEIYVNGNLDQVVNFSVR